MTAKLRVATGAVLLAMSAGQLGQAAASSAPRPATQSSHHDRVEVWRVHPDKTAARAASLTLRIAYVGSGDRGALMVVEDRHQPVTRFDSAGVYGFAYAELGNDHDYPEVYDNGRGVHTAGCPVDESCLGLQGSAIPGSLRFTFGKVIDGSTRKPFRYDFHDFYVGAVNANLTVVPQNDGWTVSRANNAGMLLIQNSDTNDGAGARVDNYTVERFGGDIAVKTPDALWSEAFAGLPCTTDVAPEYPVDQGSGTFSGFTIPAGRPSIPLRCTGHHMDEAMASGPTTWRLTTSPPAGPGAQVTSIAPTQNLNRLVVLIVYAGKPRPTLYLPPKCHPVVC